jgi:hypothetical protein
LPNADACSVKAFAAMAQRGAKKASDQAAKSKVSASHMARAICKTSVARGPDQQNRQQKLPFGFRAASSTSV